MLQKWGRIHNLNQGPSWKFDCTTPQIRQHKKGKPPRKRQATSKKASNLKILEQLDKNGYRQQVLNGERSW
jgi:hypothetical protein